MQGRNLELAPPAPPVDRDGRADYLAGYDLDGHAELDVAVQLDRNFVSAG